MHRHGPRALRTSKYSRAWQTAMMALQTASGPIPASQSGVQDTLASGLEQPASNLTGAPHSGGTMQKRQREQVVPAHL